MVVLTKGTRLGPYEIRSPLGAGGMGEVYRARDARLDRTVAVKVLPQGFAGDQDRLRRFELEAKAAGALNHPNIVVVYDVGTHEGAPYVVSELLEGHTLRDALPDLSPRKALDYGVQIARGLAAAHDKGIVHRDLKPENLLVTDDGRVKILDFGLAKTVGGAADRTALSESPTVSQQTDAGVVLGTVGYMSPEQVRGLPTDPRSDIFSLGAVLYEMFAGRRAFRGATPADTMTAILKEDPPELSSMQPDLPPAIERIVRRCLEKSAAERLQSARDVAFCLESLSSLASGKAAALVAPPPRARWWVWVAGAALLSSWGALFVAGRSSAERPPVQVRPLTFRSGYVATARFVSDGKTVVYGAAWDGGPVELFSRRLDSPEARSLGLPPAGIYAISPSGEMAISLGCDYIR